LAILSLVNVAFAHFFTDPGHARGTIISFSLIVCPFGLILISSWIFRVDLEGSPVAACRGRGRPFFS
jgi:hypothetical protein